MTWVGPYRVVEANEFSAFTVEHLVTKNRRCVHSSRLKFYHDASLNVNQEIIDHVGSQGELLKIETLMEHRWNEAFKEIEILCRWGGLEPIEDSWERISRLYPEIPKMLATWGQDKPDVKAAVAKLQERSKKSPTPGTAQADMGRQMSGANARGRKRGSQNGNRAPKKRTRKL